MSVCGSIWDGSGVRFGGPCSVCGGKVRGWNSLKF